MKVGQTYQIIQGEGDILYGGVPKMVGFPNNHGFSY